MSQKPRILVLGSTRNLLLLVREAKRLGYFVAVADNRPDSPCKKEADLPLNISVTDIPALTAALREHRLGGVVTGYSDFLQYQYSLLCAAAGLPAFHTPEQMLQFQDKRAFKALCRSFELPVNAEFTPEQIRSESLFPVVVKPIKGMGSVGVKICCGLPQFERAIEAICPVNEPVHDHLLIEKFNPGPEISYYFYIHRGRLHLYTSCDQKRVSFSGALPIPAVYRFPSLREELIQPYLPALQALVNKVGITEGPFFIQTFQTSGGLVINEAAIRLSPSFVEEAACEINGVNIPAALLAYATGHPVKKEDFMTEPARREIYAATVFHSMRPGIFDHAEIEPAFALNESVKAIHSTLSAGDEVLPEHEGTLCQRASRTLLSASSREQLDKLIQQALTSIRILDPQERDLTLR